ncbi:MAG: helix-turn-helix domain-containing protein [Clostridia bacterium]|nr:helix-turn-helix domain-containing protein [Clostridia bacterium]
MNDFNKKLGLKIKKLRERRKLTREKLGEMAEISDRFIYDIETGQKGISAETLYKLSRALNVTSDYLLFEVEENKNELSYVTEILKNLSPSELESVEKIILEISKLTSKN